MCTALCDAAGKIICLPCRLCGFTAETICKVVTGDFNFYLVFTVVINALPLYFTASALSANNGDNCEKEWLFVDLALCAANMVAAFYIAKQIQDLGALPEFDGGGSPATATAIPTAHAEVIDEGAGAYAPPKLSKDVDTNASKSAPTQKLMGFFHMPTNNDPEQPSNTSRAPNNSRNRVNDSTAGSITRVKHVLCYDPWVALYILVFLGFTYWQFYGVSKSANGVGDNCGSIERQIVNCFICGFSFLLIGPSLFFCGLCCVTSRNNFRRR